jgi:hypothetical protein
MALCWTQVRYCTNSAPIFNEYQEARSLKTLHAETLCFQISKELIRERYGKELTKEVALSAIGKKPLESWAVVREQLELQATAQELLDQSEPLLLDRCRFCPPCMHACPALVTRITLNQSPVLRLVVIQDPVTRMK